MAPASVRAIPSQRQTTAAPCPRDRDAERWRKARKLAAARKSPLWLMETANYLSYGVEQASYAEGPIWAQKIHWALTAGNCEVVCYWALFFDKKGEALIYKDPNTDAPYEITPKYHHFKHYARFVRPGMVRVSATCSDDTILVSAFRHNGGEEDRKAARTHKGLTSAKRAGAGAKRRSSRPRAKSSVSAISAAGKAPARISVLSTIETPRKM